MIDTRISPFIPQVTIDSRQQDVNNVTNKQTSKSPRTFMVLHATKVLSEDDKFIKENQTKTNFPVDIKHFYSLLSASHVIQNLFIYTYFG